jgi:hypothetical protein
MPLDRLTCSDHQLYGPFFVRIALPMTFRDWMCRQQPQFIEAGNERVCYVLAQSAPPCFVP